MIRGAIVSSLYTRRDFVKYAGLGIASLFLSPSNAYASPLVATLTFGDVLVPVLALLFGTVSTLDYASSSAYIGNAFNSWVADAGASFASILTDFINSAISAGKVLLSTLGDSVLTGLVSFNQWMLDNFSDKTSLSINGADFPFSTISAADIIGRGLFDSVSVGAPALSNPVKTGDYALSIEWSPARLSSMITYTRAGLFTYAIDMTIQGTKLSGRVPVSICFDSDSNTFSVPQAKTPSGGYVSFDASTVISAGKSFSIGDTSIEPVWAGSDSVIAVRDNGTNVKGIVATPAAYPAIEYSYIIPEYAVLLFLDNAYLDNASPLGAYDCVTGTWYDFGTGYDVVIDGNAFKRASDIPSDLVVGSGQVLGKDMTTSIDGTITDAGSIAIGVPAASDVISSWNDWLVKTGTGVLTDTTVGVDASSSSSAIAGSSSGVVSGSVSDLIGTTTNSGASTSDTSLSSGIHFPSSLALDFFPFNIPSKFAQLFSSFGGAGSSIPYIYEVPVKGFGVDSSIELDFNWIKPIKPVASFLSKGLWLTLYGVLLSKWISGRNSGGGSDD